MPARTSDRVGLGDALQARLAELGERRRLSEKQTLFRVGDPVDALSVVASGKIELCFPLTEQRLVVVEHLVPGDLLGWSALVSPYRSTLSCRTAVESEVISYTRSALRSAFEASPQLGYEVMQRLTELISRRLAVMQALWLRELQRSFEA